MKKVYLILTILVTVTLASCGSSDTSAETETTDEQAETTGNANPSGQAEKSNDAAVNNAFATDRSSISTADIDPNDKSYTTRTKALYVSDENGKKLTVVYGFKEKPSGIAIVEVEGEKPVRLPQIETQPGADYEFSNGSVTLKRMKMAVKLNENGEEVTYKEIL